MRPPPDAECRNLPPRAKGGKRADRSPRAGRLGYSLGVSLEPRLAVTARTRVRLVMTMALTAAVVTSVGIAAGQPVGQVHRIGYLGNIAPTTPALMRARDAF